MIAQIYQSTDAVGLAELIRKKEISTAEVVEAAIARIEAINPHINAVIYKDYAYARRLAGEPRPAGPLSGVPLLLKDLSLEWEGFPVTNGSRLFANDIATSSWVISERLKQAGLIPLGKTNVPEMGACTSTEPVFYGPTRNPWNDRSVAGGSSGGSAAAVAAGMVPIADASDGGGSIRIPASLNGLVGLKPSRGRITMGPKVVDFWYGAAVFLCVSRTVRDTAAYLDVVGGSSPGEPYALDMPARSYSSLLGGSTRPLTIGLVTKEPDGTPLQGEIKEAVMKAARACEQLGHRVEEFDFRVDLERMNGMFLRITATLTAAYLEAVAQAKGMTLTERDVESITWAIYQQGRAMSAMQHAADVEGMRYLAHEIVRSQAKLDVMLTPTMAHLPRDLGSFRAVAGDFEEHSKRMGRDILFTGPFNLSGQPAISLPLHMAAPDVPVGVQFVGKIGDEATLISLAGQLEQALPWNARRPARYFS